jgi:hypothetical protein
MPVLPFVAVVGSVLLALLFVALENSSRAIVTSQRTGLPAPRYHNTIKTLTHYLSTRTRHDIASRSCGAAKDEL